MSDRNNLFVKIWALVFWILWWFMVVVIVNCNHFLSLLILIMVQWNFNVSLSRVFISGEFSLCRRKGRLSTGDCPLTLWYGGFTWVFDPGIIGTILLEEGRNVGIRLSKFQN
ncbi:hypothetical protein EUTSA_v10003495mg [Eutrema salsugineum]|uniref:Transmembrane protein n=1 Tax=Eutrema salsugineum TaxID=72664 RepID=V4LPZ4_EUTSA|nr:hypothetical protein EUTSA_v10003495mg [Eutrema salsugineum]